MFFLNGSVSIAQFNRVVTITAFDGDTKDELYERFFSQLGTGNSRAILDRLIQFIKEDSYDGETFIKAELCPFGLTKFSYDGCTINSAEDVCDKLSDLSLIVLLKRDKHDTAS